MKRSKRQRERRRTDGTQRGLVVVGAVLMVVLAMLAGWAVAGRLLPGGPSELDVDLPGAGQARSTQAGAGPEESRVPIIATSEKIAREGVQVAFSIGPVDGEAGSTEVREGSLADVRFALADAATGAPTAGERPPMVWVDRQKQMEGDKGTETLACEDKVRLYVQGGLGYRPDIDLNSYYLLAMNGDATISVIDPLVSVGGMTQLYAMITLDKPGEDWALSRDEKRLFVTMPEAGQVAVVDTASFKVIAKIDAGSNPVRITLQPDGRYLWITNDATDAGKSGVTVIDPDRLAVVAQMRTGAGPHEIAFATEGEAAGAGDAAHDHGPTAGYVRYAFVANRQDGTVSIVDALVLRKIGDVKVGGSPAALDFSPVSNAVYVANEADGTIAVVDVVRRQIVERVKTAPGAPRLRFAPGGRWGFAVSARSNAVHVLDASTNRIAHTVTVPGEPDQITFTQAYAYVRSTQTTDVSLIDLAQLDKPAPPPVVQIIGGQVAPAQSRSRSVADALFPQHGTHVFIANPGDKYIYYYMEGMKAPMGGFPNYNRTPRAVRIVDRSIRETDRGEYAARIKIPASGEYQVAFLLDSPRIVHCFSFTASPALSVGEQTADSSLKIRLEVLTSERELGVGESLTLQFRMIDESNGTPVPGLEDVGVITTHVAGLWRGDTRATHIGGGVYEVALSVPRPGLYNVLLAVPSRKVSLTQLPGLTLRATAAEPTQ